MHENGGLLTLEDLATHYSTFEEPVKATYRGIDAWEIPPNSQGIVALMALNILEGFDLKSTSGAILFHEHSQGAHLSIFGAGAAAGWIHCFWSI